MARSLRSPVVLMTAYVVIFWYAGPWLATGSAPHRNVPQVAVGVLLAVLAARGSRPARMLMIIYSAVGVLVILFGKPGWTAGTSERFIWLLACYLTQVGLLVRTPMYERTRLGWRPGQYPTARFLPLPRLWVALASGAAGMAILLLPTQHFQVIACPAGHAVQRPPCLANGYGYPIAYRFTSGIFTMHGFDTHWLNVVAPSGIRTGVLAVDWALWTVVVLAALYLFSLSSSRHGALQGGNVPEPPICVAAGR